MPAQKNMSTPAPATLFIVTAASGTGKTSLVKRLIADLEGITVSTSHTTRAPRAGEVDGVDYHFTDQDTFLDSVAAGRFIEHAEVFGNFYGTMQSTVVDTLASGKDVVLEIDWQGAQQVKKLLDDVVCIFILPPSKDTLRHRLSSRGQDSAEVIENRLAGALSEMQQYVNFDYLVVNDDFEQALSELKAIVLDKRLKIQRQQQTHMALIQSLLSH